MKASNQKRRTPITEEAVERHLNSVSGSLNDVNSDVFSALWKDLLAGSGKNLSEQLGVATPNSGQELHDGEVINLKRKEEKEQGKKEGHREYFREVIQADTVRIRRDDTDVQQQVDAIRAEIKKLMKVNKQLETTFKSVAQDTRPVNPGKYHVNFMGFVLSLLRSARVRMEEGLNWANVAKSKKQQKMYWNQAKKFGTSFTLNNERNVATQVG